MQIYSAGEIGSNSGSEPDVGGAGKLGFVVGILVKLVNNKDLEKNKRGRKGYNQGSQLGS